MRPSLLRAAFVLSIALVANACSKPVELTLSAGDTMAYDVTELKVKAGQEVKLTLVSKATTPAMKHNFVLTEAGKEMEVAQAGLAAGEAKGYVPMMAAVLASSPLAQPGQTVSVTFTAPSKPGSYPYICTFPGHANTMKGTLVVE